VELQLPFDIQVVKVFVAFDFRLTNPITELFVAPFLYSNIMPFSIAGLLNFKCSPAFASAYLVLEPLPWLRGLPPRNGTRGA
jgi:hypothetical protein